MMRCIFCKEPSAASKSVEHIVPEALGNSEHVLPAGTVCDRCNNYFSRKVEKPLLDNNHFRNLRGRQQIANKRGRVPPQRMLWPVVQFELDLYSCGGIAAANEKDEKEFIQQIAAADGGTFFIPSAWPVSRRIVSRFLAKVAIEILAERLMPIPGWEEPLIDDPQLDPLRRWARIGDKPALWPYHERKIYDENKDFNEDSESIQVLHEYTLLYTDSKELYGIICILGTEYAINMGGPEFDGYTKWLSDHTNRSPLYLS